MIQPDLGRSFMQPTQAQMRETRQQRNITALALESLESLSERDWVDVVTQTAERHLAQSPAALRDLAHHLDRRVDEVEREQRDGS